MNDQKRDHFRVVFPPEDRPTLKVDGILLTVLDLSEFGSRIAKDSWAANIGDKIRGMVTFPDDSTYDIVGEVVRIEDESNEVAISFDIGIPLPKMMEQQRYLIQKYKN